MVRAVASLVTLRGDDAKACVGGELQGLYPNVFPSWTFEPMLAGYSDARFGGNARLATAWTNSQSIVDPLERLVSSTWSKFSMGAYVHHYEKHGLVRADFERDFATLEQVLSDYRKMT